MYELQLKKGGVLITKEWDEMAMDFVDNVVTDDELLFYIDEMICFSKTLNLSDVFSLIKRNVKLFSTAIGCVSLAELLDEAKGYETKKNTSSLFLELRRDSSVDENYYLTENYLLCGIGDGFHCNLSSFSLCELTTCLIFLNESNYIFDNNTCKVLFKSKKKFTLREVIKAIVEALLFIAPFKEIEEELEELQKEVQTYKLSNIKPCKICGKESRSPHFDKPFDVCFNCYEKIKEN